MIEQDTAARRVRQAWIDGVKEYYPGEPKASYILPWNEMASWEQEAVRLLTQHVLAILTPLAEQNVRLPREHGGYLVCSVWNTLMFQLLHEPKESYVKHFNQLDSWQQRTDIKMFEAIESLLFSEA